MIGVTIVYKLSTIMENISSYPSQNDSTNRNKCISKETVQTRQAGSNHVKYSIEVKLIKGVGRGTWKFSPWFTLIELSQRRAGVPYHARGRLKGGTPGPASPYLI